MFGWLDRFIAWLTRPFPPRLSEALIFEGNTVIFRSLGISTNEAIHHWSVVHLPHFLSYGIMVGTPGGVQTYGNLIPAEVIKPWLAENTTGLYHHYEDHGAGMISMESADDAFHCRIRWGMKVEPRDELTIEQSRQWLRERGLA